MPVKIRKAKKQDLPAILALIKELAAYEKQPKEVKVKLKELERDGFGKGKVFDCFVAEIMQNGDMRKKRPGTNTDPKPDKLIAGMALYYVKYSTWKGKCIYLEDIIVTESMRREKIGKKLFEAVIAAARKMKARKLEWQVLDWNTPAISFYKKYSTVFDGTWVNCKLILE